MIHRLDSTIRRGIERSSIRKTRRILPSTCNPRWRKTGMHCRCCLGRQPCSDHLGRRILLGTTGTGRWCCGSSRACTCSRSRTCSEHRCENVSGSSYVLRWLGSRSPSDRPHTEVPAGIELSEGIPGCTGSRAGYRCRLGPGSWLGRMTSVPLPRRRSRPGKPGTSSRPLRRSPCYRCSLVWRKIRRGCWSWTGIQPCCFHLSSTTQLGTFGTARRSCGSSQACTCSLWLRCSQRRSGYVTGKWIEPKTPGSKSSLGMAHTLARRPC
mmetsp:Transcript_50790/g.158706  ORF Transcript_50790/g.158706 Transcript_50790/m.158706 type:complete len:267 (+) Transcript_50790:2630-3430(+)